MGPIQSSVNSAISAIYTAKKAEEAKKLAETRINQEQQKIDIDAKKAEATMLRAKALNKEQNRKNKCFREQMKRQKEANEKASGIVEATSSQKEVVAEHKKNLNGGK